MVQAGLIFSGRYQVRRPLGQGGQGEVYEVFDAIEQDVVALKLLAPSGHPLGTWLEAVVLRRLADHHILPIRNAHVHYGQPYLVTEIARYGTVENRGQAAGACGLSVDETVRWIRHACHGIARAHDVGLVHNDIKPGNLFLNSEEECLVGDFGCAGQIDPASGLAMAYGATAATAAPEVAIAWQVNPLTASVRSDVYSLGATAYWMLAGRPAHPLAPAADVPAQMAIVANSVPDRLRDVAPHVPRAVSDRIEKAMARDPSQRYSTVLEFAAELGARAGVGRRWERTDEHSTHLACWRGTSVNSGGTYVMCMEQGATPARVVIDTVHARSGRRVSRGSATGTRSTWPRVVRRLISELG